MHELSHVCILIARCILFEEARARWLSPRSQDCFSPLAKELLFHRMPFKVKADHLIDYFQEESIVFESDPGAPIEIRAQSQVTPKVSPTTYSRHEPCKINNGVTSRQVSNTLTHRKSMELTFSANQSRMQSVNASSMKPSQRIRLWFGPAYLSRRPILLQEIVGKGS